MFELVGDDRLPALDPCIVTRFDDVGLARADVPFGTVAVHDVELTADDRAHVPGLAPLSAHSTWWLVCGSGKAGDGEPPWGLR